VRYLGPARLSFDPLLDRPFGDVLESSLQARIDLKPFVASAEVSNAFANSSDTFSFGNSLRFFQKGQTVPQRPTTLTVRIVKKY
jgi:hypothetical protein